MSIVSKYIVPYRHRQCHRLECDDAALSQDDLLAEKLPNSVIFPEHRRLAHTRVPWYHDLGVTAFVISMREAGPTWE